MNETMDEQHSPTSLCNVHGVLCEAETIYLYVTKIEGVFNSVKVRGRCVPLTVLLTREDAALTYWQHKTT